FSAYLYKNIIFLTETVSASFIFGISRIGRRFCFVYILQPNRRQFWAQSNALSKPSNQLYALS
ncbi:hypothetical protein, partial [Clostridium sp. CAG:43]|uniref:hypothetical protein n=1 Tax=Clostridium sp. CAG:43 TaxID=1262805 RepID=UPI00258D08EB